MNEQNTAINHTKTRPHLALQDGDKAGLDVYKHPLRP